jgi:hypothetical protein
MDEDRTAKAAVQTQYRVLRGPIKGLTRDGCNTSDASEQQEMSVTRKAFGVRRRRRRERSRIAGEVIEGKVSGVEHTCDVDVDTVKIWGFRMVRREVNSGGLLKFLFGVGDPGIGNYAINATMWGKLDSCFEEGNLGVPGCHVAVAEVHMGIARCFGDLGGERGTLGDIDVAENDSCAGGSPTLDKPFTKATGAAGNEDGFVREPGV